MNFSIRNYRKTGTKVAFRVNDLNVLLDEQITMAQVKFFMIQIIIFMFPVLREKNRRVKYEVLLICDVLKMWVIYRSK